MIAAVVQRLKDEVPGLGLVDGALSYAAVQVKPASNLMPAVYVVELSEAFAPPSGMSGAKKQDGTSTIAAILWMEAAELSSEAAPAALEELRRKIKDALFGWSPPGSDGAEFAHAGARLLLAEDNTVVWQQAFSLQFEERQ
jgi:hypothetical protein